jgi:hypothetical protein
MEAEAPTITLSLFRPHNEIHCGFMPIKTQGNRPQPNLHCTYQTGRAAASFAMTQKC